MKRQALQITLNELKSLEKDLIKQRQDLNKELGLTEDESSISWDASFMINIINKTPECSDTWEIEK